MTTLVEIRERKKKEALAKRELKAQQKLERERQKAEKARQEEIAFKARMKKLNDDISEKIRTKLQYKLDNLEISYDKYLWFIAFRIRDSKTEKGRRYWIKMLDESTIEAYKNYLLMEIEPHILK